MGPEYNFLISRKTRRKEETERERERERDLEAESNAYKQSLFMLP